MVVPTLFGREQVAERVVVRAFNHAFFRPAVAHRACKSPARGQEAGGVSVHAARHIVAVAARKGDFVALCECRGAGVDVLRPADAGGTEHVVVETRHALFVARGIVHTADHAVAEASEFGVVQPQAVHVDAIVLVVIGARPETHSREAIAHLRKVGIVLLRGD